MICSKVIYTSVIAIHRFFAKLFRRLRSCFCQIEYEESRPRHTSPAGLHCTDLELDELVRLEGVSAEDDADRVLGHLHHGAQGQHLVTVVVHEVQNLNMNWSVNKRNKQEAVNKRPGAETENEQKAVINNDFICHDDYYMS